MNDQWVANPVAKVESSIGAMSSLLDSDVEPCTLFSKDDSTLIDDLIADTAFWQGCVYDDDMLVSGSPGYLSCFDSELQDLFHFDIENEDSSAVMDAVAIDFVGSESSSPSLDATREELVQELIGVLDSHGMATGDGEESSIPSNMSLPISEDFVFYHDETSKVASEEPSLDYLRSHEIASSKECSPCSVDILSVLGSIYGLDPDSDSASEGFGIKQNCSAERNNFNKKVRLSGECPKKAVRREKNNASSRVSRAKKRSQKEHLCKRQFELEKANAELRLRIEKMTKEAEFMREILVAKLSSIK